MAKRINQMTFAQFEGMFPNEDACIRYLISSRWPEGVKCPRCGMDAGELATMPNHWQCYNCAPDTSYRFSHLTGTIFENTNKPLRDWFRVIHLMMTSKKGLSALQIYRTLGFGSYKTAWYMCHRIRSAFAKGECEKLSGIVEVDETFIGGKAKNRHTDKRGPGAGVGGGGKGKSIVAGAVRRKGNVVARVIENVGAATLKGFIRQTVSDKVSLLVTDQAPAYKGLKAEYPQHEVINHKYEYVAGVIHTNTIEGFWSLIKRGMVGTYHKVSHKYLPLHVAEFQLRYSNRENPEIFRDAVRGC